MYPPYIVTPSDYTNADQNCHLIWFHAKIRRLYTFWCRTNRIEFTVIYDAKFYIWICLNLLFTFRCECLCAYASVFVFVCIVCWASISLSLCRLSGWLSDICEINTQTFYQFRANNYNWRADSSTTVRRKWIIKYNCALTFRRWEYHSWNSMNKVF